MRLAADIASPFTARLFRPVIWLPLALLTRLPVEQLEALIAQLQEHFTIHYNTQLLLFTIKNYDEDSILFLTRHKEILLEQRTRTTYQFVCREE